MKRKNYQRPTMQVDQLQHQCHILAGSNGGLRGQDYELGDDPFNNSNARKIDLWDEEEFEE